MCEDVMAADDGLQLEAKRLDEPSEVTEGDVAGLSSSDSGE